VVVVAGGAVVVLGAAVVVVVAGATGGSSARATLPIASHVAGSNMPASACRACFSRAAGLIGPRS
jgi:hypothetical protein